MAVIGRVVNSRKGWVRSDCRELPKPVCVTGCLDWPGVPTKRTGAYPLGSPAGTGKVRRLVYRGNVRRLALAA